MDGPATAKELAAELEISKRRAVVGTRLLLWHGHARIAGTVVNTESSPGHPKRLNLYELTAWGRWMARHDR